MSTLGINLFNVPDTVDAMMKYQYRRLYSMQTKLKAEDTQISAYNSLSTLFTNFQNTLTSVATAFNAIAYQAASSNSSIVTASITGNDIGIGTHTVNIDHIAQAQSLTSQAVITSKTTALGIGETLTFTNNANNSLNYSVNVQSTDTLENIRDKINNSATNIGVTASIVASTGSGGTQYNLILTTDTGVANQISVSGDSGNNFQFTETTSAIDAGFTFDGYPETSSSNVIDSVMDGLSFNLVGPGTATITTSLNSTDVKGGVQTAIQNMLNAYNQIETFLDANQFVTASQADEDNRTISTTLMNDSFQTIKSQLSNAMNTVFMGTGDIHGLYDLGLTASPSQTVTDQYDTTRQVQSIGSLMIDPTVSDYYDNMSKFTWNLTNDFNSMKEYFTTATTGFNDVINNEINNTIMATNTGTVWNAINTLQTQEQSTNTQISNEQTRLASVRSGMIDQYARLNAVISKYQGLSDYLDKQYNYLGGMLKGR